MSKTNNLKKSIAAALLGTATLIASMPAQAIIAVGKWDPRYGSPFLAGVGGATNDMWWSGEAVFAIPDTMACAATAVNNYLVSCSGMTVSNAYVYLTDGGGVNAPRVDTLEFDGSMALNKVQFEADGITVKWVESAWWNPLEAGAASQYNLSNYLFSLAFFEQGSNLFHTALNVYLEAHGGHGPDDKVLFWNGVGNGHIGDLCRPNNVPVDGDLCGFSDNYGNMRFTTLVASVPEPGTYALMLAALGAAGLARRRQRQPQV